MLFQSPKIKNVVRYNTVTVKLFNLFFVAIFLYSCSSSFTVNTGNLEIRLSADGKIFAIKAGKQKLTKEIRSFTEIQGCHQEGATQVHRCENGKIEFQRVLVHDSSGESCDVIERFMPGEHSIRWEVQVLGHGHPWTAPISTVMDYPLHKETRIWTTWGRPKLDSAPDEELKKSLTAVPGSSTDEAILDKSNKDWVDPLVPVPFTDDTLFYGAPASLSV